MARLAGCDDHESPCATQFAIGVPALLLREWNQIWSCLKLRRLWSGHVATESLAGWVYDDLCGSAGLDTFMSFATSDKGDTSTHECCSALLLNMEISAPMAAFLNRSEIDTVGNRWMPTALSAIETHRTTVSGDFVRCFRLTKPHTQPGQTSPGIPPKPFIPIPANVCSGSVPSVEA